MGPIAQSYGCRNLCHTQGGRVHLQTNRTTYSGACGAWVNRMEVALLKSSIKTITTCRFRIKHVLAAVIADSTFKFIGAYNMKERNTLNTEHSA